MSLIRIICATLACVLAIAASLFTTNAQEAASPQAPGTVRLDVVVAHKNGPPVAGLEQKDFTIIDNKHTQPITSFRAVSGRDSKAKVIVVLDAVNIDYERVAFAREEIEKYLPRRRRTTHAPDGLRAPHRQRNAASRAIFDRRKLHRRRGRSKHYRPPRDPSQFAVRRLRALQHFDRRIAPASRTRSLDAGTKNSLVRFARLAAALRPRG